MKPSRIIVVMTVILLLVSVTASAIEIMPQDLIYLCEDVIPSNYVDNGELKGITIETLRLMWKKMGVPPQKIKVVPWARGYDILLTEKNHVLFSMARTKEREALFKWVGPVFTVKNVLLGRADRKLSIKSLEDARKFRIGTIKEDVLERFLLVNNFDVQKVEGVAGLEQSFEKLKLGRIDFIAFPESSLREFIKEKKYNAKDFKVFYALSESKLYYAFSKDTPDHLIQRFQIAFDSLKKEHMEILKKYGITP